MSPLVTSLLWLGLCLGQNIAAPEDESLLSMSSCPSSSSEQEGTSMAVIARGGMGKGGGPPGPSIWAVPSSVVPKNASISFCCWTSWRGERFQLWKDGRCTVQVNEAREAEVCFPQSEAAAGSYSCRYSHELHWSEFSDSLQLLVTGHFSKPSLQGPPSTVVARGDTVTFLCLLLSHDNQTMTFSLLKAGVPHPIQHQSPEGGVATFTLQSVRVEDAGNYSCIYSVEGRASEPSDFLWLEVTGHFSKPSLYGPPSTVVAVGDTVRLLCQVLSSYQHPKFTFSLLKAGVSRPIQLQSPKGNVATFTLQSVKAEDSGNYSCIYSVKERKSEPSDIVPLHVAGGKDVDPHEPATDSTVGNIVRIALAGLVLTIVGIALIEACHGQRGS